MVCSDYLDIMECAISFFFNGLIPEKVINVRISVNLIIKVIFFFIWYFAIAVRSTEQYVITFLLWLIFDMQLYLEWNYIHNSKKSHCLIWNHKMKRDVVCKKIDTSQVMASWFFTYNFIANNDPNYEINIAILVLLSIDFGLNMIELIIDFCKKKLEDRTIVYQAAQQTEQSNQQNQNTNQNPTNQNQNQGQIQIQNPSPSQEISGNEGAQIFYLGIILGSAFAFYMFIQNIKQSLEIDKLTKEQQIEQNKEDIFVYGQFNMIAAITGQIIVDIVVLVLLIKECDKEKQKKFFSTDPTKNVVLALYGLTCGMLNLYFSYIIGILAMMIVIFVCFVR